MKEQKYIPNIGGFADFCSYHANGTPIYLVNGTLHAGFDMLMGIEHKYKFADAETQTQIEEAINENMYMFDMKEVDTFYSPNDNMFSGSNAQKHVRGQVLYLKGRYK